MAKQDHADKATRLWFSEIWVPPTEAPNAGEVGQMQVQWQKIGDFDAKNGQFSFVVSLPYSVSTLCVYGMFAVMQRIAQVCQ